MKDKDMLATFCSFFILILCASVAGGVRHLFLQRMMRRFSVENADELPTLVVLASKAICVVSFLLAFLVILLIGFAIEDAIS